MFQKPHCCCCCCCCQVDDYPGLLRVVSWVFNGKGLMLDGYAIFAGRAQGGGGEGW